MFTEWKDPGRDPKEPPMIVQLLGILALSGLFVLILHIFAMTP